MPVYPQHEGVDLDPKTYTNPDTQEPLPVLVKDIASTAANDMLNKLVSQLVTSPGVATMRRVSAVSGGAGTTDIAGTVNLRARAITISNVGASTGTVNGVNLEAGETVSFEWIGGLAPVSYNPMTSTLVITTVHSETPT